MDQSIIAPAPIQRINNNRQEMLGGQGGYPDGANTFLPYSFVALTSGSLAALATGAVLAAGFVLDASKPDTIVNPPYQFFGDKHFPLNLRGMRFAISVSNTAGNVGQANGAPQTSAVTLGASYGIVVPTTGPLAGRQMLNVSDTTNTIFTVVEIPTKYLNQTMQDQNTYNPIVIVEVISSKIQIIG